MAISKKKLAQKQKVKHIPPKPGVKDSAKKRKAKQRMVHMREQQRRDGPKCGHIKKDGSPCGQPAGFGTRHEGLGKCRFHGGNNPNHELSVAKKAVNAYATPLEVTPGQALAGVLHLSAGQLQWVALRVGELDEEEVANDHGVHPLVRLLRTQMLDLAKIAKIAHEAGIDERLASLAEEQTHMFAKLIEAVAEDLELSKEQRAKLGPAVRARLSLVQGVVESVSEDAA